MQVDVSIIIVNWNTKDLLLKCVDTIYTEVKGASFEIWLVDNASIDGSVEALAQAFPEVKTIQNSENFGFAAANNKALRQMNGKYALLLNTDAFVTTGAVEKLFGLLEKKPAAAIAGAQLLNMDDSKQNSIANFPTLLTAITNESLMQILLPAKFPSKRSNYKEPIKVDSVIGACMMVRKEAMDAAGILDEDFFFFFEETDWAKRMRSNGWEVFHVPDALVYHAQGQSAAANPDSRIMFYRSRYIYLKKWHKLFALFFLVFFVRLLVNILLATVGAILTIGIAKGPRTKLFVYLKIAAWHFKGCP